MSGAPGWTARRHRSKSFNYCLLKMKARFHFQEDRERFIVARGLLRAILGKYIAIEPVRLRFRYNDYGKPRLSDEFNERMTCFNVSHSHGLALFAIAQDRRVGIDVEFIRADLVGESIAQEFFSANEVQALRKACAKPLSPDKGLRSPHAGCLRQSFNQAKWYLSSKDGTSLQWTFG